MPEGLKDAEKCIELDRAFSMGYSRKKQEERLHRRSSSPDEKPSSSLLTSFVLLGLFGGLLVRSRGSHIRWQRLLPGVTGSRVCGSVSSRVEDGRICGCSEASRFAGLLLASSKGAQEVLLLGGAWSLAPARDGTLSLGFVLSSMARHLKLSHPSALFSSSTSVFVSFSPFLTDLNCASVLRVGLLAMNPCVAVLFYGCVVSRLRVSKIWHIFQFKPVFNGKLKLQR
ncbi:hypothetical protein IGI04_006439 [Brassica rapa subsp. trilocularis]|uniref:Transmembrane protein n=1 Tax=Brassica rapa subsp. trilocularis TaxID=1813537 RepID=A0ABQ7NGV7_BRACM|nr:hypothetical protein IGI04_006439 [Brassica rapa subsp. trilocularis]